MTELQQRRKPDFILQLGGQSSLIASHITDRVLGLNPLSSAGREITPRELSELADNIFSGSYDANLAARICGDDFRRLTRANQDGIAQTLRISAEGLQRNERSASFSPGTSFASWLNALRSANMRANPRVLIAGAMTSLTVQEFVAIADETLEMPQLQVLDINLTQRVQSTTDALGIPTVQGDFLGDQGGITTGSIDIIVADHLVEHLGLTAEQNPFELFFQAAQRALVKGGVLATTIEIPQEIILLGKSEEAKMLITLLLLEAGFTDIAINSAQVIMNRQKIDQVMVTGDWTLLERLDESDLSRMHPDRVVMLTARKA